MCVLCISDFIIMDLTILGENTMSGRSITDMTTGIDKCKKTTFVIKRRTFQIS